MSKSHHTKSGEAMTLLILDIFRLNGRLLIAGDRLVSELGLTSARWQILGAIAYAEQAETVASHARSMGVHRQGVQRIVNELEKEGIIEFQENPNHKRAHLIALTSKGHRLFEAALELQIPWVNKLSEDLNEEDISAIKNLIQQISLRLENPFETSA